MTESDILAGLTQIFHEVFDDDSIVLTPQTTAEDVPGWDSFAHINILVASEARFGIKFNTAEIEGLRDIGQLVHLIAKKVQVAPA